MSTRPAHELVLSATLVEAIVRHLAAALPNEGCGLLAGVRDEDRTTARRFFPGTNLRASPSRFEMEPREVIDALRAIRTAGEELVAIVHSHPRTPATPSVTDLAEAYYPSAAMLIVSYAAATPELRAWHMTGAHEPPDELPVRVERRDG